MRAFENILVPFDGSPVAAGALRVAIGLAGGGRARLTLLCVLNEYAALAEMQMASPLQYARHLERLRSQADAVLEQGRSLAAQAGIAAQVLAREARVGRVGDAICAEAAHGYDAVVMGTHGRRGIHRLLLGSDAEFVVRHSAVPVLLVPPAAAPAAALAAPAGDEPLVLPPPRTEGGMPLRAALRLRRSSRAFEPRPLEPQLLSDLLWAACGVNRAGGERTAPCWRHVAVIDVHVLTAQGSWRYDPAGHRLLPHGKEDLRGCAGTQDFVAGAPLQLVYVAHGERMGDIAPQEQRLYAGVDAGFIGQNVYLCCAAEGLACVFRGALDAAALEQALRLPAGQFVTFAQTVGFAPA